MRNFTSEQATEMAETNPQAKRKRDTRQEAKISREPSFTDEKIKEGRKENYIIACHDVHSQRQHRNCEETKTVQHSPAAYVHIETH
jgi:hypothetical protein